MTLLQLKVLSTQLFFDAQITPQKKLKHNMRNPMTSMNINDIYDVRGQDLLNLCSWYCWWKKSCTSWYGKYLIIYRVLAPSQVVVLGFLNHQQYGSSSGSCPMRSIRWLAEMMAIQTRGSNRPWSRCWFTVGLFFFVKLREKNGVSVHKT